MPALTERRFATELERELYEALTDAAAHFEGIERKALHWMKVCARSEIAEGRWSQIKNHAGHRGRAARAALADTEKKEG